MFCRNCGRELTGDIEICAECGMDPTHGTSFCLSCGIPTTPLTEICPQCGAWVGKGVEAGAGSDWMPLVAGILDLVAGIPALLLGIVLAVAINPAKPPALVAGFQMQALWKMLPSLSIPLIIAGIIAVAGGFAALKKKVWWLALVGSVIAALCLWIVGIPALIFTIMGKKRFA